MNMKRTLTAILALALAASAMSVTAFAADNTFTEASDPGSQNTKVTYTVAPGYTVTIPAEVALGTTAKVSVSRVKVAANKEVFVKLSAASSNRGTEGLWVSTDEGAEIEYTINNNSAAVDVGDIFLTVQSTAGEGGRGSADLEFSTPDFAAAGDYSGTVTFTVGTQPSAV